MTRTMPAFGARRSGRRAAARPGGIPSGLRVQGALNVSRLTRRIASAAIVVAVLLLSAPGIPAGLGEVRAASPEAPSLMLTPWEGFVGVEGERFGAAANPAGLAWLSDYALQVRHVRPVGGEDADAGGRAVVYFEPDTGLGAGQLAYLSAEDDGRVRQFVYSAAWRSGGTAVGFSVRHVTYDDVALTPSEDPPSASPASDSPGLAAEARATRRLSGSAWSVDGGYRGQWTDGLGAGVLVRNVLTSAGEDMRAALPTGAEAGVALELGGGLTLAVDYIVPDVRNLDRAGWKYGLEGRFGRVLARLGRLVDVSGAVVTFAGLGYVLETLRLDAAVTEVGGERVLSLGLSLYF